MTDHQGSRKRAGRSCVACRKSKTRCIGWDHPPCTRCSAIGVECNFSKAQASQPSITEPTSNATVSNNNSTNNNTNVAATDNRIRELEEHIRTLSKTVTELTQQQKKQDVQGNDTVVDGMDNSGMQNQPSRSPQNANEDNLKEREHKRPRMNDYPTPTAPTTSSASPTSAKSPSLPTSAKDGFPSKTASSVPLRDQNDPPQSGYLAPFEMLATATSNTDSEDTRTRKAFLPSAHQPPPANLVNFPHAIDKGFISAREAYHLLQTYFDRCHLFAPILDTRECSYDQLTKTTPFLVNAILTVVLRLEARAPYKTIEAIAHEAYSICTSTLLWPSCTMDNIQAIAVLASWSWPTYLLSGHALRLGLDMRLDHAFDRLEEIASVGGKPRGHGKQTNEEEERNLVRSARLWLQLVNFDLQVSITGNRPIMLGENERIAISRCSLLTFHPYALPSDVKLVADLALASLKIRMNDTVVMIRGFLALNYARRTATRLDQWHEEWDSSLSHHYSQSSFVRQSMIKDLHFSRIYLFSSCLRSAGVVGIDFHRQDALELVILTQQSALVLIELCIRKNSFSEALQYATPSVHLEIAFTSILLLKLGRFFPDTDSDLSKGLHEKIEKLIKILSGCVGAQRYIRHISEVLSEYESVEKPSRSARPRIHTPANSSLSTLKMPFDFSSDTTSESSSDMRITDDTWKSLGLSPQFPNYDQHNIDDALESVDFSSLLSTLPSDVQALFSVPGPLLADSSSEEQRMLPVGGLESIFTPGWANELGGG